MKYSIKGTGNANVRQIANGFLVVVTIRKTPIQDLNDLLKPDDSLEGNPVYEMLQNVNKALGDTIPEEAVEALAAGLLKLPQTSMLIPLGGIPGLHSELQIFFSNSKSLAKFIEMFAAGEELECWFPNEAGLIGPLPKPPLGVTMEDESEKK